VISAGDLEHRIRDKRMKNNTLDVSEERYCGWRYRCIVRMHFYSEGGFVSIQKIVRAVRNSVLFFLMLMTVSGTFLPAGLAQNGTDRKVKSRVTPVYPEIARKMGLTGNVKLQLVVAPNGEVKETKVIGGHPILVNAAVDAVKKWRYETASAESTGTVEFRFDPGN
jgi:protein TonB